MPSCCTPSAWMRAAPSLEPSLSDSSSGGSFGRSPSTGPRPFSSSLGHINHLGGSLDLASRAKEVGPLALLNQACLNHRPPYGSPAPGHQDMGAVVPDTCEELKRGLG